MSKTFKPTDSFRLLNKPNQAIRRSQLHKRTLHLQAKRLIRRLLCSGTHSSCLWPHITLAKSRQFDWFFTRYLFKKQPTHPTFPMTPFLPKKPFLSSERQGLNGWTLRIRIVCTRKRKKRLIILFGIAHMKQVSYGTSKYLHGLVNKVELGCLE